MNVSIMPSVANGVISAPPSKSMAHRLLICAGFSKETSTISNLDPSQDVLATMDCLKALGAEIHYENRTATLRGVDMTKIETSAVLPCRECGSTLRFFIPICLLCNTKFSLNGSEKLFSRPLSVYESICKEQNIYFEKEKSSLNLQGMLKAGDYEIPGNISSQFISGLLFALPLLSDDSRIHILPPIESKSYLYMTMEALATFGIQTVWEDDCTILIPGGQSYQPRTLSVEGDYSNAAFLDAFSLIGGHVDVNGLKEDSLQGDKVYRKYFQLLKQKNSMIDLSDCPDLGPILIALASAMNGAEFIGTERLKIKESDRGLAMKEELEKMGASVNVLDNTIRVSGSIRHTDEILNGHNDHRIVMALSVILSLVGGKISGANAIQKSYPNFFEDIENLGIKVIKDELDQ